MAIIEVKYRQLIDRLTSPYVLEDAERMYNVEQALIKEYDDLLKNAFRSAAIHILKQLYPNEHEQFELDLAKMSLLKEPLKGRDRALVLGVILDSAPSSFDDDKERFIDDLKRMI